jgi:hypothetical protein
MTTKAIKISEENYKLLSSVAGELQREEGRPISMDEALGKVLSRPKTRKTMLDLAELKDDKEFIKSLENAYKKSRMDMGRRIPSW